MQKWEYLKLVVDYPAGNLLSKTVTSAQINDVQVLKTCSINFLNDYLNKLGQDGWEMVGTTFFPKGEAYIFKRPIEE